MGRRRKVTVSDILRAMIIKWLEAAHEVAGISRADIRLLLLDLAGSLRGD
jgi:DUF1365 family protein